MNARMSTKPVTIKEEDLHKHVKSEIQAALKGIGSVPYLKTELWEEFPTHSNPHWTKITFYGYGPIRQAFACYEGKYGIWEVCIEVAGGRIKDTDEAKLYPCTRVWGKPVCCHPSDEWRESTEARRARIAQWIEEGIL